MWHMAGHSQREGQIQEKRFVYMSDMSSASKNRLLLIDNKLPTQSRKSNKISSALLEMDPLNIGAL